MHDKFEKEVQQKMEELQLTPSAPVWEKIELEIRPEKKRRRIFFWLFFGVLLAGGGLMTYYFAEKDQLPGKQISTATSGQSTGNLERKQTPATTQQPTESLKQNQQPANTFTEETQPPVANKEVSILIPDLPVKSKAVLPLKEQNSKTQVVNQVRKEEKPGKSQQTATIDKNYPAGVITPGQAAIQEKKSEVVKTENPTSNTEKPVTTDSSVKEQTQKTELPKAVDSLLKKKVAKTNSWRKQLLVSGGKSSYKNLFLFTGNGGAVMDANSPITSGGGGGTAVPIYYVPAETKGGLSFAVGFSFAKKLNEHFEVAVGLQYSYSSTHTKVGTRRDSATYSVGNSSSFSRVYTNTATASYTNRFHVAELPITLNYKPSVNLPLYVSVGVAYGRLVSTNALTFNNGNNLYFDDKENYIRNMLPASAAVQVELFSRKKTTLRIGPSVQYNLLKLQKQATEGERHLFFAGLKSTINF